MHIPRPSDSSTQAEAPRKLCDYMHKDTCIEYSQQQCSQGPKPGKYPSISQGQDGQIDTLLKYNVILQWRQTNQSHRPPQKGCISNIKLSEKHPKRICRVWYHLYIAQKTMFYNNLNNLTLLNCTFTNGKDSKFCYVFFSTVKNCQQN